MGKNKLRKFADMQTFSCVLQYPFAVLHDKGFPHRGSWRNSIFRNNNPIVLELGCGKGEYTVELARRNPGVNFIGIDIKGARIWTGASLVEKEMLKNVAFLRTDIELLQNFFEPAEVDEIWITFPDPQMQKTRKRLTSTRFLSIYQQIMRDGGILHLKTDSPFLYEYTHRLRMLNGFETVTDTSDLYGSGLADAVTSIKTFYEQQWLSRGMSIKLIEFRLPSDTNLVEPPEDDIPHDMYHSFQRGVAQNMPSI